MFAQPQVKYLGYIVSSDGIRASPDKTKAVTNFLVPKNVKDFRPFLGLASFYKRLVPKFAPIAKPLTELLRNDAPFIWSQHQQVAFEEFKKLLSSDQVLNYPDFSRLFILTTDASKVAVSAILSHVQDGVERPIIYKSRQMTKAEQNYSASEAEKMFVTWGTRHFRCYLYWKRFKLTTDHTALKHLQHFRR
jgi:hypothetical protein